MITKADRTPMRGAIKLEHEADMERPEGLLIQWYDNQDFPTPSREITHLEFLDELLRANNICANTYYDVLRLPGEVYGEAMPRGVQFFLFDNKVLAASMIWWGRINSYPMPGKGLYVPKDDRSGCYFRFWRIGCEHPHRREMSDTYAHERHILCPDCGYEDRFWSD